MCLFQKITLLLTRHDVEVPSGEVRLHVLNLILGWCGCQGGSRSAPNCLDDQEKQGEQEEQHDQGEPDGEQEDGSEPCELDVVVRVGSVNGAKTLLDSHRSLSLDRVPEKSHRCSLVLVIAWVECSVNDLSVGESQFLGEPSGTLSPHTNQRLGVGSFAVTIGVLVLCAALGTVATGIHVAPLDSVELHLCFFVLSDNHSILVGWFGQEKTVI